MIESLDVVNQDAVDAMRQRIKEDSGAAGIYASAAAYPPDWIGPPVKSTIRVQTTPPLLLEDATSVTRGDAENARRIYEYLGELSLVQASDERLWVTLAHGQFWGYAQRRWQLDPEAKDPQTKIIRRWFIRASQEALESGAQEGRARQCIARLWWGAHWTVAPWERDPEMRVVETERFHFTNVLFSLQDIHTAVAGRRQFNSPRLRIAFLKAIQDASSTNKGELVKTAVKAVLLLLKHRQVAVLPFAQQLELMRRVVASADDAGRG